MAASRHSGGRPERSHITLKTLETMNLRILNLRFPLLGTLAVLLCVAAPGAHAQFGVYLMGSAGILGATPAIPGTSTPQNAGFAAGGFTVGAYDDFAKLGPLRLGLDGRYFTQSSSNSNSYGNKLHGGLVGVRLALQAPLLPIKPYLQAEVGGVGTNYGVNADTTTSSAWQINGGLDFTIFPHIDLRAEYGGGSINAYQSGTQTLQELGGGAVFRF